MLTALELSGFKSFADKTRFDFPDGITVVVGPNGSGKSNIVDAIKWVLGTQSAKSLRGEDMADVIFKGSAAGGRKPCNSAEATLILDNRDQRLAVDAPEVHVTRRVYRSGESEYLLNREPCRLKDIKDLFRGTGVGIDAYSLIEQGKVDRMLQASAKDRRAIFEEAAGISRFKVKKVETERRMQRVDQNLVRLKDIVDEVHTRLSNLKSQAAKAQQYREMTERVSVLRLQIGIDEHQAIQSKLEQLRKDIEANEAGRAILAEQLASATSQWELAESQLGEQNQATQVLQSEQQTARERIAGLESSQAALAERLIELAAEREVVVSRQSALEERAELTADEVANRVGEVESLQAQRAAQADRVTGLERDRMSLDERITELQQTIDSIRTQSQQLDRQNHQNAALAVAESTRVAQLERQLAHQEQQSELHQQLIAEAEEAISREATRRDELERHAAASVEACEQAESQLEQLRAQCSTLQETAIHQQGGFRDPRTFGPPRTTRRPPRRNRTRRKAPP